MIENLGWKVHDDDPNDEKMHSFKTQPDEDRYNINRLGKLIPELK